MSEADGSLVFVAELDDSDTQKKLSALTKKIDSLQDSVAKNSAFKLPLVEQAEKLGGQLDAAKAKLDALRRGGATSDGLKEQQEVVSMYQTQWNSVNNQIDAYDRKINSAAQELTWSQKTAGDLAKKLAEAGYSAEQIANGIEQGQSKMKKFSARLKSVIRSALIFTVITQALSKFRDWIGDVVKATPEASAAMAKLKGALLTMVQPLVDIIIPAFTALANVLTAVIGRFAQLFSFLAGTSTESSAQAAEALNEQTEALNGTGSAAKKASKSLAGFDEINKLSSPNDSGSSGDKTIAPDFNYDDISSRLKEIGDAVIFIGTGFALWKISDKLPSTLGTIASKVGLIAIAIGGVIIFWNALKDAWENGVDWDNLIFILGSAAAVATALYKALGKTFGKIGAGIALIVAGAAMIVTAFHDIIENGANLKNTLLLIAGIVATGLGFFLLTGSTIPLVIAAILAVIVAVLGLTGNLEAFMKNLKENILGGLIDFITGVFTGDWEKAWGGVKKVFYGIFSAVVMIFESALNLIIKGLNWLIDKMNNLLAGSLITKGLELVGVHFTGIPHIPEVDWVSKIPELAQGAVIPPNREFLAVLGDQRSGTNIETPLATMVQAFKQALSETNYSGQSEAYLMLDDIQLGKVIYRLNKSESNRIGVSLVGG